MGTTKKIRTIKGLAVLGLVYGLLLGVVAPRVVLALTNYPPAALLQPEDITGTMLRDGTINDFDIQDTAGINLHKIATTSLQGGLVLQMNEGLATSTGINFATSSMRLGVGSSTPGANLAVGGNAIISGSLQVGNIIATGTKTFSEFEYTPPVADGSSGQLLSTNGAGALSWVAAGGGNLSLLATNTAAVATGSLEVKIAKRNYLKLVFWLAGNSGNTDQVIRFNTDGGGNYSVRRSSNGGADDTLVSQPHIDFSFNSTVQGIVICDIINFETSAKRIICHTNHDGSKTVAPSRREMFGMWDNTTAQITSIRLFDSATGTSWGAGSELQVFGAQL